MRSLRVRNEPVVTKQEPAIIRDELALKSGSFQLTPEGIVMVLNPPIHKLSGFCGWNALPSTMEALRTLVNSDDPEPGIMKWGLTDDDFDALEQQIGDLGWHIGGNNQSVAACKSNFCADIDQLIQWGAQQSLKLCDRPTRQAIEEWVTRTTW
jgi:hypothetical protein